MDALVILGATGTGKSDLALELAGNLGVEIVSVDSRQIYKRIDIGTSKPTRAQRDAVPHHMIDLLELDERINASLFACIVENTIEEIISRDKLPVLVGGSGLYFRAIFEGLFDISLDEEDRAEFAESIKDTATNALYEELCKVDPDSGDRIHPNDRYRISRALEVHNLSGTTLSEHILRHKSSSDTGKRSYLKIGIRLKREELYERIDRRTVFMIENGWVEEVGDLLDSGFSPSCPGLKTLGYPEVISYVQGEIERDMMINTIQRLTRQYAKRQETWFRSEADVTWFDAHGESLAEKVISAVTRGRDV